MDDKASLKDKILDEIDDTQYDLFALPHQGLVPDYFIRYWDLAEMVHDYFDEPFYKPKRTPPEQLQ